MTISRNWIAAGTSAMLGVVIPIVLIVIDGLSTHGWWPDWIIYVWPTSYMMIATSAIVDSFWYEIVAIAVGINAVLYALVGLVVVAAVHPFVRATRG